MLVPDNYSAYWMEGLEHHIELLDTQMTFKARHVQMGVGTNEPSHIWKKKKAVDEVVVKKLSLTSSEYSESRVNARIMGTETLRWIIL